MALGWFLVLATVGSTIWVFFDAPRHGLSRGWSLACLLFWVIAFPWYLMERATTRESSYRGPWGLRGLVRRLSQQTPPGYRWAVLLAAVVAIALTAATLWELRLIFRGPYMLFLVRHPALVSIPLLAGALGFLAHLAPKLTRRALRGRGKSPEPARRSRKRRAVARTAEPRSGTPRTERPRYTLTEFFHGGGWRGHGVRSAPFLFGPAVSGGICAATGLLFAAVMTASWTGSAIYRHSDYGTLSVEMLRGGEPRIKPYEVARRQSQNGLNSPTERPTNLHIVKVGGELLWTSVRDPDGFFRVLSKPTRGVMSVGASSTAAAVRQSGRPYDADFRYGPGMRFSENIRWQVYKKKCYSCDVAEMTGVPSPKGPLVIAPYTRYVGNWLVRRPTFGGVYVAHPDGRIDDLSPAEAMRSSLVRESGRLFPEGLARRIADAYKFKRGIWNRLFVHTDQLEVADTENNRQPFLQDFGRLGAQWVTTLKPRGRTFTTAGVMTTDAVSGQTRVWLARRGQSLIGNQRALDIVRGESFPGIDFAERESDNAGGKFRVVEPRQVFPDGRLHFLLSIIPNAANRVTMSVVIDADSQRVTAKFPASPEGDADLIAYLRTGRLPSEGEPQDDEPEREADSQPGADPDGAAGEDPEGTAGQGSGGTDPASTLRRLLRENRAEQRSAAGRISDLKAQERDLLRLLGTAREEPR